MRSIKQVISNLGYSESDSFYDRTDLKKKDLRSKGFSIQTIRLLETLNPFAFYCIDNKPFVLFYEYFEDPAVRVELHKVIWNAQIPVAIMDCGSHIEIYNGSSLVIETHMLQCIEKVKNENINEFSHFSYWNITNSNFWNMFDDKFSQPKLDTLMLNNIGYIIEYLKKKNGALKPFAIQLTLRLIFIRYLIDKGIDIDFEGMSNEPEIARQQLVDIMESKSKLYLLFEHLKNKFNGNLFDFYKDKKTTEMALLDVHTLKELRHFMSGKLELPSGQFSLFPMYDFNIIPVELISNIYERLLGPKKQQTDKAFYTPPHLVDYILNETIVKHLQKRDTCTILDPSCGSGIFLVEALRILIENNLNARYFHNDEKLIALLTENIFGVDKNSEAINVAIFSLYLTLFDYKDPKCLRDFKLPMLKGSNFFESDFFSPEVNNQFKGRKFDFIIGNPPWGSVKDGLHSDYCKDNGIPLQNNEIAQSFLARLKDFSSEDTQCCIVVTSKIFYNTQRPASEFRKWLLTQATIKRFIELSPVRKLLFKEAQGPAAILFYSFKKANSSNEIDHLTLMPNILFKLFNIIVIETNNWKKVPQSLLLNEDWAWKTMAFGAVHDYYNVKQLKRKYETIEKIMDKADLLSGVGIRTSAGRENSEHLIGKKLIDSRKGIKSFETDLMQTTVFDQQSIFRARNKKLFKPPYILFKKGINVKNYKLRAAYSEDEFLYRDTITGIKGTIKDKDILLSLTGLINSSFYAYLNVLLGSSVGIEREQVLPSEVLSYPAKYSSALARRVECIQNTILKQRDMPYADTEEVDKLIKELDEYVLSIFNLKHDSFVRYMLDVQIPLLTGSSKAFEEVEIEELKSYAKVFIDYWDGLLNKNGQYVKVDIYPSIMNRFAAIRVSILENTPTQSICIVEESNAFLDLISKFALTKHNDLFYHLKDIINFEEKSFHILKMNESKNWHTAMAELDLSKVLDSILTQKEEE